jgi:hypothetical protein
MGGVEMEKRFSIYFTSADELELFEKIQKYSKQKKVSISRSIFDLLKLTEHLQTEVKRLKAESEKSAKIASLQDEVIQLYRRTDLTHQLLFGTPEGKLSEEQLSEALTRFRQDPDRFRELYPDESEAEKHLREAYLQKK